MHLKTKANRKVQFVYVCTKYLVSYIYTHPSSTYHPSKYTSYEYSKKHTHTHTHEDPLVPASTHPARQCRRDEISCLDSANCRGAQDPRSRMTPAVPNQRHHNTRIDKKKRHQNTPTQKTPTPQNITQQTTQNQAQKSDTKNHTTEKITSYLEKKNT